jgi:hypothetical protein
MNPRHAAALALVGWYLMVPPVLSAQSAGPTSTPQWRPDAPASPPPPGFEHRPGDWTAARKMCGARLHDRGCRYICSFALELWSMKKAGRLNQPNTFPPATDKPQGPFALPGGAKGYILPAQSAPSDPKAVGPVTIRAQDSKASRDKLECPNSAVLGKTLIPDSPYAPECQEILHCSSEQSALVEGYQKCVNANAGDPTNCSAFMHCLNAAVVHGPHANP